MQQFLVISQVVVSLLLITFILLQKGGGLFGKETGFYRTLRGVEKKIFWGAVFLGFVFIALGVLNLMF